MDSSSYKSASNNINNFFLKTRSQCSLILSSQCVSTCAFFFGVGVTTKLQNVRHYKLKISLRKKKTTNELTEITPRLFSM